jgi:hypothetical protein
VRPNSKQKEVTLRKPLAMGHPHQSQISNYLIDQDV